MFDQFEKNEKDLYGYNCRVRSSEFINNMKKIKEKKSSKKGKSENVNKNDVLINPDMNIFTF